MHRSRGHRSFRGAEGAGKGSLCVVTQWGEVIQRRGKEREGVQKFGHTSVGAT